MENSFYYSIASGSKGNCALLSIKNTKILIDFGVSLRCLKTSLLEINLTPDDITAVVITHEHSDHIKGLATFSKNFNTPVYISHGSAKEVLTNVPTLQKQIVQYYAGESLHFENLSIHSFLTPHDSSESVGFLIETEGFKFGYVTDIGFLPNSVKEKLVGCDMVVIEANHDKEMLQNGIYPYYLKKRVASNRGHLSNDDCAKFVLELFENGTDKVLLAHLSENNNTPDIAFTTVNDFLALNGIDARERLMVAHTKCMPRPISLLTVKSYA